MALVQAPRPVLLQQAAHDRVDTLLRQHGVANKQFVVIAPRGNWETKRWPIESFAQLVGPLRERFGATPGPYRPRR